VTQMVARSYTTSWDAIRHLRETLTESRQRYKDLVEISSDFAWETDAEGRFAFVSPAGALGWTPAQLVGGHPRDSLIADDDLLSPFETRRPVERLELWMRAANGSAACLEVAAKPLFTRAGLWNGARGVCRDLTGQVTRAAELSRLRNRESALARIAEVLRDAPGSETAFPACVREAARALGVAGCALYACLEGSTMPVEVAASREAGETCDAASLLEDALAAPEPVTGEAGSHSVLACATRLEGAAGGMVAVWRPAGAGDWEENDRLLLSGIAERIAVAQAQFASRERLGAILNTVVDGIVTIDIKGTIRSLNPAAARIFGYREEEATGRPVEMLMPDGATRGAWFGPGGELTGRRRDGTAFPMELAVGRMEIAGTPMFTAVVRDISERKEVERMKAEFISTVSHELRTPLTAIRGSLSLVNTGVMGDIPEDALELTVIAEQSCERLVRLINDILDIEKIGSSQLRLEMKPTSLVEALERAVADTRPYGEQFGVGLSLAHCPGRDRISADFDRLVQIFTNLISNACKFSPAGGEVALAAAEAVPGRIRVSVADHGPGIPEAFRCRIFGKFAQADASDSKIKGGTGLGLAITRSLTERMDGAIWFESEVGRGTVFFVEFPLL
ncbi:MAG: PAS domain S-box protein, partial [Rhodospirillaceae bacterium]